VTSNGKRDNDRTRSLVDIFERIAAGGVHVQRREPQVRARGRDGERSKRPSPPGRRPIKQKS
jgi:hypothetical protein